MANMAMQYGSSLADQGKDYVNKNVGSQLDVVVVTHKFILSL
jgi:hypothetical protein